MVTRGNEGSRGNEAFDLSKNHDLPDDTPDINKLDLLSLLGEGPGQGPGIEFGKAVGQAIGKDPLTDDSSPVLLDLATDRIEGDSRGAGEEMSPHWSRIQQGDIADCHFVASMQAMARHPGREALKQMIETLPVGPDGRRSWQVTFPGGSHPVTVVEDELYPRGAIQVGADQEPLPGLAGQWPSVLEAAAGKLWTEKSGPYGPYRNPALQLGHSGDVQWSLLRSDVYPPEADSNACALVEHFE